jgi:hypothetical protein
MTTVMRWQLKPSANLSAVSGDAQQTVKSASSRSICLKRGPNHNVIEVWERTCFVAVTSEGEREGGVAQQRPRHAADTNKLRPLTGLRIEHIRPKNSVCVAPRI